MLPKSICDTVLMDFDALKDQQSRPRHGGGHRHGQVDRRGQGDRPAGLLLQARELRPVHAVPRGHRLDVARDGAHGHGQGASRGDRRAATTSPSRSKATRSARWATRAAWPIQGLIRHFRPRDGRAHPHAHRKAGGRVGGEQQTMPIVKIDGKEHRGARGHHDPAGLRAGRRRDPALLLPRAPVDRRQLPHVPGRGEARPAQAAGVLRHAGRRQAGDHHQLRRS